MAKSMAHCPQRSAVVIECENGVVVVVVVCTAAASIILFGIAAVCEGLSTGWALEGAGAVEVK
jgi:hypothetical protein